MEDHKLDELLEDARTHYRASAKPDVDAIWSRVESEAFRKPQHHPARRTEWQLGWKVAAASLVIGALAGRWSAGAGLTAAAPVAAVTAADMSLASEPYQRTTEEVLGRSAVLLAALRSTETPGAMESQMTAQATRLLGSVRLLLDSPAATDPTMHTLLLDLELTLAQVARLQPARSANELTMINEAVAERDIVPRIRSAVVDLSAGGY
jgi:hypothetical protein